MLTVTIARQHHIQNEKIEAVKLENINIAFDIAILKATYCLFCLLDRLEKVQSFNYTARTWS